MRSIKQKITATVLAVLLTAAAVLAVCVSGEKKEKRDSYVISAEVDGAFVKAEMVYTPKEKNNGMSFCLFPNAFKTEENAENVAVKDKMKLAYPNGFDSGYISITAVTDGKKTIEYGIEENGQIMVVPGKHKKICIEFALKLPDSPTRFGYGENTYNFGNWFPIACPSLNGETVKSVYNSYGDPFCSECSDFTVTVTAPSAMRLATSGQIQTCKKDNPLKTTWIVNGENIRDFAFVLSDEYSLYSKKVGETLVYSYYLEGHDEQGENALNYACDAIETFNSLYCEYPYGTFTVAEADFYIGGMEYPNLVYISTDLYSSASEEALEEVVVHETAHQWFYGLVGNDEINEPWLDEGLTEYSVGLYYENRYSRARYEEFINSNAAYCKVVFSVIGQKYGYADKCVTNKTTDFDDWIMYNAVVYDYASLALDTLRKNVGDGKFFEILKTYATENMYCLVSAETLYNTIAHIAGNGTLTMFKSIIGGEADE